MITIPRELNHNRKKVTLKPSYIYGPPRALHFLSAEETAYNPNTSSLPPNPPAPNFSRLTEAHKGFIGLGAPSDSSGHLPPWHAQVSSIGPSISPLDPGL